MEEKKISTSIEVLVKVADFESIRIAKYSEKKITYSDPEEMARKEDELGAELIDDLYRCMKSIPERIGKKTLAPISAIQDKIQKKIPEWLANNPVPNLAKESAEKGDMQASNKADAKKEKQEKQNIEIDKLVEVKEEPATPAPETPAENSIDLNANDLFDDEDLFK